MNSATEIAFIAAGVLAVMALIWWLWRKLHKPKERYEGERESYAGEYFAGMPDESFAGMPDESFAGMPDDDYQEGYEPAEEYVDEEGYEPAEEGYEPPYADAAEGYADLSDTAGAYEPFSDAAAPFEAFAVLEAAPYGDGNAEFRAAA